MTTCVNAANGFNAENGFSLHIQAAFVVIDGWYWRIHNSKS